MKGHIRSRGPGSWAIVLDLGRDAQGKRRQKWHTVRGPKREAQRELTRLLHELNTGGYVEPARLTVGQYLERWLSDYAKANVSGKTYERYAQVVRDNLIPALGQVPLAKLYPLHIQGFYSQGLDAGRKDGSGGLSAQTVLHFHRVLREALQQAVRWQMIARNPADAVEPPRPARKEMRALDEAAAIRLLQVARETSIYLPVVLALATGMRRGEIMALKWEDVDAEAGSLVVCRSLEVTKGNLAFKQPKTAKGRRKVALPAFVTAALIRHRASQARHRLLLGPAYQDHGLVMAAADGRPMHPDSITTMFRRLTVKADLQGLRFHDLRHTHATQLLLQGVHPKVVSERLGHSTVGITLDTYSHVLPGMQEEAARRIDAALGVGL